MSKTTHLSRRNVLKLSSAAAATALIAGCGGDGGNGNANGGSGVEIDSGTTIEFSAQTTEWQGLSPSPIEDTSNPTLVLQEGEDYTIGWTNIEIRNNNDEVVNDLETEVVTEPIDDQMLDITASSEMAQCVCQPHEQQMRGDIQI